MLLFISSFVVLQARTRIHYNSDHPEFNQELNVQFKVSHLIKK